MVRIVLLPDVNSLLALGGTMEEKKNTPIRIDLTEEQKQVIREATGRELDRLEFTAEVLEERIAPMARRA